MDHKKVVGLDEAFQVLDMKRFIWICSDTVPSPTAAHQYGQLYPLFNPWQW
jgi:hypothetical protein